MDYIKLLHSIFHSLSSSKNLLKNLNSILIQLNQYIDAYNPLLIFRDRITNQYFIALSPELSKVQKQEWNKENATKNGTLNRFLEYQMLLSKEEVKKLQFPISEDLSKSDFCMLNQPLSTDQEHLPLGTLCTFFKEQKNITEKMDLFYVLAKIISLHCVSQGYLNQFIKQEPSKQEIPKHMGSIVGNSAILHSIIEIIKKVAPSKASVLIHGESGTGKELIAKAIHENSLRNNAPYISLNCAALSDHLLESELFGHEKGAFTGAISMRKGRFELADGGTLFLDEIGDTSLEFQTKLLRILQEGEFERIGGTITKKVDVRIVCATNVDLEKAIEKDTFREDLFYRLNVISINVPPLRERTEDIPHLVHYFLECLNQQEKKNVKIHPIDLKKLMRLPWKGNIRELQNRVHSAFIMQKNDFLFFNSLPKSSSFEEKNKTKKNQNSSQKNSTNTLLQQEEIESIQLALEKNKGFQKKAAEDLGISLRQLRYRIKKYNILVRKIL